MAEQKNGNFDFEIPGQIGLTSVGGNNRMPDDSEGSYKRLLGDKPITWLWLMQHYSKENAAAYKAQKEKRKTEKLQKKAEKEMRKSDSIKPDDSSGAEQKSLKRESKSDIQTMEQEISKEKIKEENFGSTVFIDRSRSQNVQIVPKAELDCVGFGRIVEISKFPFRIGRSLEDVELCIADNPAISSVHAEIMYEAGTFYIKDLTSLNHVFIDGVEIPPEQAIALKDCMKITLANEEFVFHNRTLDGIRF